MSSCATPYSRNPDRFRLFSPDETSSNRLGAVFEASNRAFAERVTEEDVAISRDGRVMEVLSEHACDGWLEGYTLTGRHGWFATYEAFAMVSASQTVQHAKWLQEAHHLHGMTKTLFDELFTDHSDVLFAFHGYPGAIHQLVHGRPDTDRFHVRGFVEEGTTTTPFDMVVRNRASRYHLVIAALDRARRTPAGATEPRAWCERQLVRHEQYVVEHLQDMPEVRDW